MHRPIAARNAQQDESRLIFDVKGVKEASESIVQLKRLKARTLWQSPGVLTFLLHDTSRQPNRCTCRPFSGKYTKTRALFESHTIGKTSQTDPPSVDISWGSSYAQALRQPPEEIHTVRILPAAATFTAILPLLTAACAHRKPVTDLEVVSANEVIKASQISYASHDEVHLPYKRPEGFDFGRLETKVNNMSHEEMLLASQRMHRLQWKWTSSQLATGACLNSSASKNQEVGEKSLALLLASDDALAACWNSMFDLLCKSGRTWREKYEPHDHVVMSFAYLRQDPASDARGRCEKALKESATAFRAQQHDSFEKLNADVYSNCTPAVFDSGNPNFYPFLDCPPPG